MSAVGEMFSSKKPNPTPVTPAPKIEAAPESKDEKLARVGRASLISTSSQGVLGEATTGRKKLSV
jgi:hypothetical protein